ncbi:MAG TPA: type II toxin-antitoxin system RelE/ParE family toxin [Polyangia bacterium]|nr:type II toxin-antitoxin system RelE/ParE family toxin [Polyangia bacterium]
MVQRIIAAVDRLISFPTMGRVVPEVGRQEIRELIVGAFRVVYRHRNEVVEIVTVFRATRLFPGISV